jgi:hypothetical protein
MKPIATVISVQEDLENGYRATVNIEPGNQQRVELVLDGILPEVDPSQVSDIDPEVYSVALTAPGRCPFKVGDQIPVKPVQS